MCSNKLVSALLLLALSCGSMPLRAEPPQSHATSIPSTDLIQPADFAEMLRAKSASPVILQVGFSILFAQAHIPQAQYAGPTSRQDGIDNLKSHVEKMARDQLIVIYCGCCPWVRCPNMAPAYQQLHALGFTNVKALYLADNFGADWVDKGYPVVRGQ